VIDRFHAGATISLPAGEVDLAQTRIRARIEAEVLELLQDAA
jgi:hypothetical protein